jgi:hypothetical protein
MGSVEVDDSQLTVLNRQFKVKGQDGVLIKLWIAAGKLPGRESVGKRE